MLGAVSVVLALSSHAPVHLPPNLQVTVTNTTFFRCPSEAAVLRRLAREMASVPMFMPELRQVEIVFLRDDRGLAARIDIRDKRRQILGVRRIPARGPSCRLLADSAVLALTVALQQTRMPTKRPDLRRAATAEARHAKRPASAPVPAVVIGYGGGAAPHAVRIRVGQPQFELSFGASAVGGTVPTVAVGGRLGVAARWSWLSIGLEAHADQGSIDVDANGRVRKIRSYATCASCVHVGSFAACGFVGGGTEQTESFGALEPVDPGRHAFFVGGARVSVDLALTQWLAMRPWVEAMGQTSALDISTEGGAVHLYRPGLVTWAAGAAVVSRF